MYVAINSIKILLHTVLHRRDRKTSSRLSISFQEYSNKEHFTDPIVSISALYFPELEILPVINSAAADLRVFIHFISCEIFEKQLVE